MCLWVGALCGDALRDEEFFAGLRPELAELARQHRQRCQNLGLSIIFTAGFRSPAAQIALYEQGRSWDDKRGWYVVDPRAVVTNATPEHAPHCRGAAYDCAPVDAHEKIDWNNHQLFWAVAQAMPKGLVWGGSWPKLKDMPHYELPNWRDLPMGTA